MRRFKKFCIDSLDIDPAKGVQKVDPNIIRAAISYAKPTPFPDMDIHIGDETISIENGEVEINGVKWKIELADFLPLKEKFLTDIVEGGHYLAGTSGQYKFFPPMTIWIDRGLEILNAIASAIHEVIEITGMTRDSNTLNYKNAHDIANKIEHVWRGKNDLPPNGKGI